MFKIYIAKKDREFDYYIVDNKLSIEIQAILFFILVLVSLFVFGINIIVLFFGLISTINIFVVLRQIAKSQENIKHQSISYKMEDEMNHLFFKLKVLCMTMEKNNVDRNEIEKWEYKYVNKVKDNKNMIALKSVDDDIDDHFYKIMSIQMPSPPKKEYDLFIKNDVKKYYEKFYPSFLDEVASGKFTLKARKGEKKDASDADYLLGSALKKLGLPSTITDLKIVKKKYYELVRMYHPDHNNILSEDESQEKMCEINEAFDYIVRAFNKK